MVFCTLAAKNRDCWVLTSPRGNAEFSPRGRGAGPGLLRPGGPSRLGAQPGTPGPCGRAPPPRPHSHRPPPRHPLSLPTSLRSLRPPAPPSLAHCGPPGPRPRKPSGGPSQAHPPNHGAGLGARRAPSPLHAPAPDRGHLLRPDLPAAPGACAPDGGAWLSLSPAGCGRPARSTPEGTRWPRPLAAAAPSHGLGEHLRPLPSHSVLSAECPPKLTRQDQPFPRRAWHTPAAPSRGPRPPAPHLPSSVWAVPLALSHTGQVPAPQPHRVRLCPLEQHATSRLPGGP